MKTLLKRMGMLFCIIFLVSCGGEKNKEKSTTESTNLKSESTNFEDRYEKVEARKLSENLIRLIAEDWTLITAGDSNSYNTMTASWGTFGELWGKDIGIVFVRKSRYTHEFLEKKDFFTLSFFDETYRDALRICGTKSGRDGDKVKEANLTKEITPMGNISFAEARIIVELKKMYAAPFQEGAFVDKSILEKLYKPEEGGMHTQFIGEIVNVWVKRTNGSPDLSTKGRK